MRGTVGGEPVVPRAEPRSYYGRPVLKAPVWKRDIPAYFVCGGVMAGSSLLAAGADLTANPALRRAGRLAAAAHRAARTGFLRPDLGRPERLHKMRRVAKPTSPLRVGTWVLALYGPGAGLAAASEATGRFPGVGRAAGLAAAAVAPVVATYTAVLTADTAIPAWHDAHRHLPFVFAGSAGAASGGLAMALVAPGHAGPARRLAAVGAAAELVAARRMEAGMGPAGASYARGRAGHFGRWARRLTLAGLVGTAVLGRRRRTAAVVSGAALVVGSACTRFAVYHAGLESAADPGQLVATQRAEGPEVSASASRM